VWILLQKVRFCSAAFGERKASPLILPNYMIELEKKIFIEVIE